MSFIVPSHDRAGRYLLVFVPKGMPFVSGFTQSNGSALQVDDEIALALASDVARTVQGQTGLYDRDTGKLVISITPGP